MRLFLLVLLVVFVSLSRAAAINNNVTIFSPLGQRLWYYDLQPVNSLSAFLVVGSPSSGGNQVTVALVNQHNLTVEKKVVLPLSNNDFYGAWIAVSESETQFMVETESPQSLQAYFFVYTLPELTLVCNSSKPFQQKTHSYVYQFLTSKAVYVTSTQSWLESPQQLQSISFSSCSITMMEISPKGAVLGWNLVLSNDATIFSTVSLPGSNSYYQTLSVGSISSSGVSFSKSYKTNSSGLVELPQSMLGSVDDDGVLMVFDMDLNQKGTYKLQMDNYSPNAIVVASPGGSIFVSADNADDSRSVLIQFANASPYKQLSIWNISTPYRLAFTNEFYAFGSSWDTDPFWNVARVAL